MTLTKFRFYLTRQYVVIYNYFSDGQSMVVIVVRADHTKLAGYAISRDPDMKGSRLLSKAVVNMTERHLLKLGRDAGLHDKPIENRC